MDVPVVKPGEATKTAEKAPIKQNASFYVSYAKDIFCALIGDTNPDRERAEKIMEEAILFVKQAAKAFE